VSILLLTMSIATVALANLLPRASPVQTSLNRVRVAVSLLTVTAIVFRSEVAILLFAHVGYLLLKQIARFGHLIHGIAFLRSVVIPAGVLGAIVGLSISVPIDTFFWQSRTYLWPELAAFLSNIFPSDDSAGASAWGTSPWHWYFTSALPRLMMKPFIYLVLWALAVSSPATAEPALDLLLPNLAYTAIYSFLPHKETRFIFPIVPPLNLAAALGASHIWIRRQRTRLYWYLVIPLVGSTILSALIAHAILLPISSLSYPGAHALNSLHNYASSSNVTHATNQNQFNIIRVHLDNLSTQTGITRFLQHPAPTIPTPSNPLWLYDKSDNTTDLLDPFWWDQFDYIIMEAPRLAIGSWEVVDIIRGLGRVSIPQPDERRGAEEEFWEDGVDAVASEMYGSLGGKISVVARSVLRDGYGVRWLLGDEWSWTRGYWVDVGWVPKLYVLERRRSLAREEVEKVEASGEEAAEEMSTR
jgi:alpha-1,6-mannosyltransferase